MKAILLAPVLLGIALCTAAQESNSAPDNSIHLSGCVQKGVEAGCLVLKDAQSGVLYQLLIRGPRPQPGTEIEITGALFRGITSCMQGRPVSVTQWSHNDALQCPRQDPPAR